MHGDASVERHAAECGPGGDIESPARFRANVAAMDWRTVDRALRAIRQRRAALDGEEARWLREAEALQIWRPLGMVSALDYLERVLGYAPRTAQDRLRVARALGDLPRLTEALAMDELSYSAVRELTRVATPATEAAWVVAATGKNLRQIEELVADRRPGDRPDDPPDPAARTHVVRFELSADTFAVMRQVRSMLDDEHGTNLTDDGFIAALCSAVLDEAPVAEPSGRARYQIAMTVCERCRQGWQDGAGARVAVDAAAVDRALCDAQDIGSLDGAAPERAHQDIPPSVARFVWRRDGGRCRIDGCRSARGLELHHLIHRADGGSHDASNLILACSACHQAHHAGVLTISGTADRLVVRRPGQPGATPGRLGGIAGAHESAGTPSGVGAAEESSARSRTQSIKHAGAHGGVDDGQEIAEGEDSVACALRPGSDTSAGANEGDRHNVAATDGSSSARSRTQSIKHAGAHGGVDEGQEIAKGEDAVARGLRRRSDTAARVQLAGDPHGSAVAVDSAAAGWSVNSRLEQAILRTQAKAALMGLGWKSAIAQAAVMAAAAAEGPQVTLERLIFASLRQCPTPNA